eukprot:1144167-Pelagomonas_calceolata.AAC.2
MTSNFDVLTDSPFLIACPQPTLDNLHFIWVKLKSSAIAIHSIPCPSTSYPFTNVSAHVIDVYRKRKGDRGLISLNSICWVHMCSFISIYASSSYISFIARRSVAVTVIQHDKYVADGPKVANEAQCCMLEITYFKSLKMKGGCSELLSG